MDVEEFKKWITKEIKRFVREDPGNRLEKLDCSPIFEEPLVGFVAGGDPIFYKLKEVIGEFHLTPYEAMSEVAKERGVPVPSEEEIGVISYILPISKKTRKENARMKDGPSERWAHTRLFGEEFNRKLEAHIVSFLEEKGYFAVAPELERSLFRMLVDEKVGWASTWSQRHVAFAANLGTFGLSDGLISEKGKAHRAGSVIVNQRLDSPQRTSDIHRDCRFFQKGSCKRCVKRCPAGAITEEGHDKNKCQEFVFKQIPTIKEKYDIDIYACGLCQTAVPCEEKIPRKKEKREERRKRRGRRN
nr:epoxyqueuosine reductase [Candidatus Freyarchaeota archaeon]